MRVNCHISSLFFLKALTFIQYKTTHGLMRILRKYVQSGNKETLIIGPVTNDQITVTVIKCVCYKLYVCISYVQDHAICCLHMSFPIVIAVAVAILWDVWLLNNYQSIHCHLQLASSNSELAIISTVHKKVHFKVYTLTKPGCSVIENVVDREPSSSVPALNI